MKIMIIGSSAIDEAMLATLVRKLAAERAQIEVVAPDRVRIVEDVVLRVPTEYLISAETCPEPVHVHDRFGFTGRRNKSDRKRDRASRW